MCPIEALRKTWRVGVRKGKRTVGAHGHGADDGPGYEIPGRLDVIGVTDGTGHGQNKLPGRRDTELQSGSRRRHGIGYFAGQGAFRPGGAVSGRRKIISGADHQIRDRQSGCRPNGNLVGVNAAGAAIIEVEAGNNRVRASIPT